jgi:lipoyl-dependent peroxiredoxin subunit D
MTFATIINQLPIYAHDLKLNLQNILTETGAPGLTLNQIYGIVLAAAYALRDTNLIALCEQEFKTKLTADRINAIKISVSIMAMNNLYYNSLHLNKDPELRDLPINLNMEAMANPGVSRLDFSLYSLVVSAVNSCGPCLNAHSNEVIRQGLNKLGLQSALRIAAVMKSLAQVMTIEKLD